MRRSRWEVSERWEVAVEVGVVVVKVPVEVVPVMVIVPKGVRA